MGPVGLQGPKGEKGELQIIEQVGEKGKILILNFLASQDKW